MNKYPGRLTRKKAREMFEHGKPFVIVPVKCPAYTYRGIGEYSNNYYLSEYATIIYPIEYEEDMTFDKIVNAFEYYNCNSLLGYYAAFYEAHSDILATYV